MIFQIIGIVQKVFSEKASAIARMHQKCVKNASKWVKMGLVLLGKEERPKCKNARNTFGGEHLLDDTEISKREQQIQLSEGSKASLYDSDRFFVFSDRIQINNFPS